MQEDHPISSSMGSERSIQFHFSAHQDSSCNFRHHSYPPLTRRNTGGKRNGTASIPIDRKSMRKTASEHRMAQEEAEADYKDYLFFSRVVDGISKQNSLLQDGSYLKSTNETLLDNIMRARHEEEDEVEEDDGYHHHYYYPSMLQAHGDDMKIVTPAEDDSQVNVVSLSGDDGDYHIHHEYEDEGVFDFEL